ncbi:MAG: molybdenum cofactor biosynthesis protein MoaE [Euryarchaeota archaeon]|nr:molybdenum cofactor biosynthesis protein MoaE [Euryarchaeota archaeon]
MILAGKADEEELLNLIGEKKGSIVSYFGYVRSYNDGKEIKEMICTSTERTKETLKEIEESIMNKYPVENLILYHSVGTLKPGDLLAAVIVSTVHRAEGFEACRYGIDKIKKLEPVKRVEVQEP